MATKLKVENYRLIVDVNFVQRKLNDLNGGNKSYFTARVTLLC